MREFIKRLGLFLLLVVVLGELMTRVLCDPMYYFQMDSYIPKSESLTIKDKLKGAYRGDVSPHPSILCVGSSRIPACLGKNALEQYLPAKHNVVVAGRGFSTPYIHCQALSRRLELDPNYLMGCHVIVEYTPYGGWTEHFNLSDDVPSGIRVFENQEDAFPQFLMPHLDLDEWGQFVRYADNSIKTRGEVGISYWSGITRNMSFMRQLVYGINWPSSNRQSDVLANAGGIRNDMIDTARRQALDVIKERKTILHNVKPVTIKQIDSSYYARIVELVRINGGTVSVIEIPLHSLHKNFYSEQVFQERKKITDNWLKSKNVEIITFPSFVTNDVDFPDIWHLSANRREEFCEKLAKALQ